MMSTHSGELVTDSKLSPHHSSFAGFACRNDAIAALLAVGIRRFIDARTTAAFSAGRSSDIPTDSADTSLEFQSETSVTVQAG